MKQIQIFLTSVFLTIGISLFTSASGKTIKPTTPLLTSINILLLI